MVQTALYPVSAIAVNDEVSSLSTLCTLYRINPSIVVRAGRVRRAYMYLVRAGPLHSAHTRETDGQLWCRKLGAPSVDNRHAWLSFCSFGSLHFCAFVFWRFCARVFSTRSRSKHDSACECFTKPETKADRVKSAPRARRRKLATFSFTRERPIHPCCARTALALIVIVLASNVEARARSLFMSCWLSSR